MTEMAREANSSSKPDKQSKTTSSLPPQSSAQDTSNWDDRLFLAPGVVNPNYKGKKIRVKGKNLLMSPNDDAWNKRQKKQSKD